MRPLGDKIIVQRDVAEETTESGIYVGTNEYEKSDFATVLAVGNGKKRDDGTVISMDVEVGNRILINKYAGADIIMDEKPCIIITEADVLAIIDSE